MGLALSPVLLVGLQHHAVAGSIGHQLVGPGADGSLEKVAAGLGVCLLADHRDQGVFQHGQLHGIRSICYNLNSIISHYLTSVKIDAVDLNCTGGVVVQSAL